MEIKAKNRLKEVLSFWHKAANSYQDVDEFVINLNACIQASRNVTWVLQSQKKEISGFDSWYVDDWQTAMKNDPVMRWCVDARNTIVKQEDLAIYSVAHASIHNNYLLEPIIDIPVDPLVDMSQVAAALLFSLPEQHKAEGFVRLERQWKVKELEIELLSALAHVATVLMTLINDVDERKGAKSIYPEIDLESEKLDHETIKGLIEQYSPEYMKQFEDYRVAWFSLPNIEQYDFKEETNKFDLDDIDVVNPEYEKNRFKKIFSNIKESSSFREKVEIYADMAKQILENDSYHIKLVVLFCRSGAIELVTTEFQDQRDKYVFWHNMAKKVRRKGVKEIISIGEAWVYSVDDRVKYGHPSLIPNKKEVLLISGLSQTGECIVIQIPFFHENENIVFSEKQISYETPNSLMPIKNVWKKDYRFKR
jgi:hypothetical protein